MSISSSQCGRVGNASHHYTQIHADLMCLLCERVWGLKVFCFDLSFSIHEAEGMRMYKTRVVIIRLTQTASAINTTMTTSTARGRGPMPVLAALLACDATSFQTHTTHSFIARQTPLTVHTIFPGRVLFFSPDPCTCDMNLYCTLIGHHRFQLVTQA